MKGGRGNLENALSHSDFFQYFSIPNPTPLPSPTTVGVLEALEPLVGGFLNTETILTSLLIYLTLDQCTVPWGNGTGVVGTLSNFRLSTYTITTGD